jgi:tetratricopeptide (TPR) repeat protein
LQSVSFAVLSAQTLRLSKVFLPGTVAAAAVACNRAIPTGILLAFAVAAASISCNRNPDEIKRKYLRTGDKYFAIGKYRQASIMYRSALRLDGRFGEGYYHLALAELKEGRLDQSVKPLRAAVELLPPGPDSCDAKSKLANIYLTYLEGLAKDKSVRAEADRLVSDLIQSGPGVYDGHRLKGRLAMLDAADANRRGVPDQVKESLSGAARSRQILRPCLRRIVQPLLAPAPGERRRSHPQAGHGEQSERASLHRQPGGALP